MLFIIFEWFPLFSCAHVADEGLSFVEYRSKEVLEGFKGDTLESTRARDFCYTDSTAVHSM